MCLCMQANRCKHVRTFLIGYRSGGTPYILRNLRRVLDCGPLSEEAVPASAPATSRLFVLPVATRRWVLTDNSLVSGDGDLRRGYAVCGQDGVRLLPVPRLRFRRHVRRR